MCLSVNANHSYLKTLAFDDTPVYGDRYTQTLCAGNFLEDQVVQTVQMEPLYIKKIVYNENVISETEESLNNSTSNSSTQTILTLTL